MDDCSTADIERLRPKINGLALSMSKLQADCTTDLEPRDQVIVLLGALNLIRHSSRGAAKKMSGSRFIESISRAMHLTRMFGSGSAKVES